MKVFDFPLIKITASFVLGILFSYYLKPSLFVAISVLFISIITFILFYFLSKNNKNKNVYFGINTYLTSFFIGLITLLFHTDSIQKSNYIYCKKVFEKPQLITLTLCEKLKSNAYNDRYIARVYTIQNKFYSGKIILNIQKDSAKNLFLIGNRLRLKTTLQRHGLPKNPNQFDYGKYLTDKQIYAQIYTQKSEIEINKTIKKDIRYYMAQLHARIIRNLQKNHFNAAEMNVALALILGQRQEISSDIVQDYRFSGATHILSVSGLHVGFIILFIQFVLRPIPNNKKGAIIKLSLILGSLFFFAILSGLSPSVLRSVVMFSFLVLGEQLRRTGNFYHTLLVSMLLILLFEPYFLFDIGFQLSYLALFFIVWLQPLCKQIWTPKNKILQYIWKITTVSIAAQIGTLPLCLYYFHQFPGLFFVTNVIILPILSFIMIIGIVVVFLAVFDANPDFLVFILEKSIYLLNQTIHFVASFESFVIKNIRFPFSYLIAFYMLIIASIIWFKKPTYHKIVAVLLAIILLQTTFIFSKKEIEEEKELIVYNLKKNTIISERKGDKIMLFASDSSQIRILDPYLIDNAAVVTATHTLKNSMFFNGKKIFIIDNLGVYPKHICPDILILTQSPKINFDRLLQEIHPKIVVADASNIYAIQKNWKASCAKKSILFYATGEKGFYKLN